MQSQPATPPALIELHAAICDPARHAEAVARLRAFLDAGGDCNCSVTVRTPYVTNQTLLTVSANNGWLDGVAMLLAAGATSSSDTWESAIHNDHTHIVRHALEHDPGIRDFLDNLLTIASERPEPTLIRMLLAAGASSSGNGFIPPLVSAAKSGRHDNAVILLAAGADVAAVDDWALLCAVQRGHTDIVRLLLAHGADIHAGIDKALITAVTNENHDMAAFLLAAGADVNAQNGAPIAAAALLPTAPTLITLLLSAGARAAANYSKAMIAAASVGNVAAMKCLFAAGANPRTKADEPLHQAILADRSDAAEWLLARGANIVNIWSHLPDSKKGSVSQAIDALAPAIPEDQRAALLAMAPRRFKTLLALAASSRRQTARRPSGCPHP